MMNQALRPQPQLGEVLPGALTLGLFLLWFYDHDPAELNWFWAPNANSALLVVIAGSFLFASWIAGTLIDAVRNSVVETVADWCSKEKLNWDFLFTGDRDKVAQLDEYYFAYYQAKCNYAVGLLIFIIFVAICYFLYPIGRTVHIAFGVAVVLCGLCTLDARSLRQEMKRLTREVAHSHKRAVHAGVYTRLRKSEHGVGVFAIIDIPDGVNVFEGDTSEMQAIEERDLVGLDPDILKLYKDFCVWKDGKIICPTNFNNMTVGWYLNHSESPNLRCDENYDFISIRSINRGQELTVDYRTYDDRGTDFSEDR